MSTPKAVKVIARMADGKIQKFVLNDWVEKMDSVHEYLTHQLPLARVILVRMK